MDYDPLESRTNAAETYDAFGASAVDPPSDPGGTSPATDKNPATPGPSRSTGLGSSLVSLSRDRRSKEPDPEGILFGKYRLVQKLGEGGMGDVWLVEHLGLGVNRALKIIKTDIAEDNPSNRLRFQQEAKILAQIGQHPNAVAVHDTGFVDGLAYIEMDWLQGQTLGKWLKARPCEQLPPEDALELLEGLCDVLGEAHKMGIVHRDIKPGNIMIVADPKAERGERVKVLDFGIAKIVRDAEGDSGSLTMHTRGYLGTVPYSSPEQLGIDVDGRDHARVDHRSDIYSLGVLLYEMLAGSRPFTGPPTKILYDHVHTPPPRFAERTPEVRVPRAVEKVVLQCLEKRPDQRPQSARELYELFREAVRVSRPRPIPAPRSARGEGASTVDTKVTPTTGRLKEIVTSFLTQWGLPRSPRKPALRLFFSLAVVAGVASAVTVLLFYPGPKSPTGNRRPTGPDPSDPPPPPQVKTVPSRVIEFLDAREFMPVDEAGVDPDGWPKKIRRIAQKGSMPLKLRGNLYLPEDVEYEAKDPQDGGLPRVLTRLRDKVKFRLIQGGEFWMGAWDKRNPQKFRLEERPSYRARVSSFYMQETEVTNGEIWDFMANKRQDGDGLDRFRAAKEELLGLDDTPARWEDYPAVGMTRAWAEDYAHLVGGELPTEQQWEFAARSRGQERHYVWKGDEMSGDEIRKRAHIHSEQRMTDHLDIRSVALKSFLTTDCTDQGIHGLAGNVREWCRDQWRTYPEAVNRVDYVYWGNDSPTAKYVIRGGSFETEARTARVAHRSDCDGANPVSYQAEKDKSFWDVGFRVVLEVILKEMPGEVGLASRGSQETSP